MEVERQSNWVKRRWGLESSFRSHFIRTKHGSWQQEDRREIWEFGIVKSRIKYKHILKIRSLRLVRMSGKMREKKRK